MPHFYKLNVTNTSIASLTTQPENVLKTPILSAPPVASCDSDQLDEQVKRHPGEATADYYQRMKRMLEKAVHPDPGTPLLQRASTAQKIRNQISNLLGQMRDGCQNPSKKEVEEFCVYANQKVLAIFKEDQKPGPRPPRYNPDGVPQSVRKPVIQNAVAIGSGYHRHQAPFVNHENNWLKELKSSIMVDVYNVMKADREYFATSLKELTYRVDELTYKLKHVDDTVQTTYTDWLKDSQYIRERIAWEVERVGWDTDRLQRQIDRNHDFVMGKEMRGGINHFHMYPLPKKAYYDEPEEMQPDTNDSGIQLDEDSDSCRGSGTSECSEVEEVCGSDHIPLTKSDVELYVMQSVIVMVLMNIYRNRWNRRFLWMTVFKRLWMKKKLRLWICQIVPLMMRKLEMMMFSGRQKNWWRHAVSKKHLAAFVWTSIPVMTPWRMKARTVRRVWQNTRCGCERGFEVFFRGWLFWF
ncbi:uncharacterized protein LOC129582701 [Paramacrobiotus metropolitanus]|uniref:uncharacterized protein LOC129582701 n=1 Tax=Paramacrobiotus metropolitanus TaxID=2943436 RepID=UPI00244577B3|nr:uncharacterized protein LOC129582701 [Paramacrobiotus metropolitanus]